VRRTSIAGSPRRPSTGLPPGAAQRVRHPQLGPPRRRLACPNAGWRGSPRCGGVLTARRRSRGTGRRPGRAAGRRWCGGSTRARGCSRGCRRAPGARGPSVAGRSTRVGTSGGPVP